MGDGRSAVALEEAHRTERMNDQERADLKRSILMCLTGWNMDHWEDGFVRDFMRNEWDEGEERFTEEEVRDALDELQDDIRKNYRV